MELLEGNQAIVKGAIKAGANYYAGYPITPATSIMENWVKLSIKNQDLKFLQTEDEIAAIHSIIGASLAGSKSFTATSGPGFSLMQEGIGLAYAYEIPLVIINSQRQGPSTGMPTLPAQGDLLQTQYGSHGDYNSIVFYPSSVQECFEYTIHAFNAAEISESPVFLLTDAFTSHMIENVNTNIDLEIKERKLEPLGKGGRYFTGLTSEDNIAKTKDAKVYKKWIARKLQKVKRTAEEFEDLYEYNENNKSKTLIVSFGIISRVIDKINKELNNFSTFRPGRLFPMLKKLKSISDRYERIVVVEMNQGQYANYLSSQLNRSIDHISIIGGEINYSEIKKQIRDYING